MRSGLRSVTFAVALAAGIAGLGAAAWIPAKAWLAQVLLEVAWQASRSTGDATRPWPWADTSPVARLRFPAGDVDQIVLAGASGRVLAFGPGHVTGSAAPGVPGNVVISAHRDTHFRWLRDLQPGARLVLEAARGGQRHYRVVATALHHERDSFLLDPDAGDRLTLITCYPFDAVDPGTPQRFVVIAVPATS